MAPARAVGFASLALLALTACGSPKTSVLVDVQLQAGATAPSTLTLAVYDRTHALVRGRSLAVHALPGSLLLDSLPATTRELRVVLAQAPLLGGTSVTTRPSTEQHATIVLSASTLDTDGDGVPDSIDDCPTVANADQADADGDGVGDACQNTIADLSAPDLSIVDQSGLDQTIIDQAGSDLSAKDFSAPDLSPPIYVLQSGSITTGNANITLDMPQPSKPGTLLVAMVAFDKIGPASMPWYHWYGDGSVGGTSVDCETWYYPNNPGNISSVSGSLAGATVSYGVLMEWQGVTNTDQGGSAYVVGSLNLSVSSGNPTTMSQELGLGCFVELLSSAQAATLTPSSGWTSLYNNNSSSTALHYSFDYQLGLPMSVKASETEASTVSGLWAAAISTYH